MPRNSCRALVSLFVGKLFLAVATSAAAQMAPAPAVRFDLIWSSSITYAETGPQNLWGRSQGLVLTAMAVAPGGRIVALGEMLGGEHPGAVLLPDAMDLPLRGTIALRLTSPSTGILGRLLPFAVGANRRPGLRGIAVAADGAIWVGGHANCYMTLISAHRCDSYLARLDAGGGVTHERTYDPGPYSIINGILPLAGGNVIVVGQRDGAISWLGRVAPNGRIVAEASFGNGNAVATAAMRDGRVLVVGIVGEGEPARYRDDVSAWLYDEVRGLGSPIRVREGINRRYGSYLARVAAVPAGDGAYIASSWDNMSNPAAVEIARVEPSGAIRWRTRLPGTLRTQPGGHVGGACDPAIGTRPNGDALVACAVGGFAQLYRIDAGTGQVRLGRIALPECASGGSSLFLVPRNDGQFVLAGSTPASSVRPGCSWLGLLTMPDH